MTIGKVALRKRLTRARRELREAQVLRMNGCAGLFEVQQCQQHVEEILKALADLEAQCLTRNRQP